MKNYSLLYRIYYKFIIIPFRKISAYRFDKINNVSTKISEVVSKLDSKILINSDHAYKHDGAHIDLMHILFNVLAKSSFQDTFIDIGCGQGRACFYAASKYTNILGIDFSPYLINSAINNLKTFKKTKNCNIKFEIQDASSFILPERKSLVFIYNPFDDFILEKFIDNNKAHFIKHGSRIAYVNDVHRNVLQKSGFKQEKRCITTCGISLYSLALSPLIK